MILKNIVDKTVEMSGIYLYHAEKENSLYQTLTAHGGHMCFKLTTTGQLVGAIKLTYDRMSVTTTKEGLDILVANRYLVERGTEQYPIKARIDSSMNQPELERWYAAFEPDSTEENPTLVPYSPANCRQVILLD